MNLIKRRGVKALFLAVDDLWLYNYHSNQYDGTALVVFETIQFIEERQWEVIQLDGIKEELEGSVEQTDLYNLQSNPTYLDKERKSNLFIASTMDFFALHLPVTLVMIFLLNRLFCCLFNFKASIFLRPYSFWWILLELLVQGNVEIFTFLALRNCLTPYHFDLPSRLFQVLMILVFFLVVLASYASYSLYYQQYGKLARYFLVNMFRFPSSYVLMAVLYGLRPFLKGAVHALMYYNWELQMWFLFGVELAVWVAMLGFEFGRDSHRSKPVFMMDACYYGCLILLDLLFLCKYEYFKRQEEVVELLEELITTVVYLMVGILILKFIYEGLPWDFLKQILFEEGED